MPGTRGYRAITMAWTVGELVHRAAGRRLGRFFDDEIARPLGLDFWIGAPAAVESRISPMLPAEPDEPWLATRFVQAALGTEDNPTRLFMRDFLLLDPNTAECHQAEVGSANGVTNARGLAGMYAPLALGGSQGAVHLVGADTLARMGRVSMASHDDATLLVPSRFALGYMKTTDNRRTPNTVNSSMILSEPAFGHVGAGGSIGFADPECRMSFGYAMNRMGTGILLNAWSEPGRCGVHRARLSLERQRRLAGVNGRARVRALGCRSRHTYLAWMAEEHRPPVGRPVFKTGEVAAGSPGGFDSHLFRHLFPSCTGSRHMTLQAKLETIKQGAAARIPAATLARMADATRDLRASGILERVIAPGQRLPAFALPNQAGAQIRSEDLLARGAGVLTVFRGRW